MSKQHVVRRSLAMRYALVTSVLILCILTAILWAYLRYDQEKISASYSIESAQTIERSNGILRGLLLRGEQTRSSFLISPLPDLQNNTIAFNEQALSHVRNTLSSDELDLSTSARLIYQDIEKHIQRLIQKTRLLIEVRLDREQLFPAMSFIVDGMYPANLPRLIC